MLRESPSDPRLLDAILKSIDNFRKACSLLDSPVNDLKIPFGDGHLPGYLFLPQILSRVEGEKVPVVVNTAGFDSTQEELYHFTASGARKRGYATLTFEGPGQGIVLRREKSHLRPDWEVVISAVLDELFRLANDNDGWNLDLSRIAIIGNSMGGYFALRGATDPRIKACISSDGFYDFGALARERTPFFMKYLSDKVSDKIINFAMKFDYQNRWELLHAQFSLGKSSVSEALREISKFTLAQDDQEPILDSVTCPVLVTRARNSIYPHIPLHTILTYQALRQLVDGESKVLWDPISEGQGSTQAKVAALSHLHAKVFGWLDTTFGIKRSGEARTW